MFGYKEMVKALLPNLVILAGATLLGIINPFVIIPLLLASGGIQALFSIKAATKKIKDTVAENITKEILSKAGKNGEDFGQAVFEKLQVIQDSIQAGMENEILAVKDSVDSALAILQQGEFETLQKKEELENSRDTLRSLLDNVNEIIDNA